MNRTDWTGLKSTNIRDYTDNPKHRQAMGYFKYTAHRMGILQAELLFLMQEKSLKQINDDYDFKQGNCIEFKIKGEQNG